MTPSTSAVGSRVTRGLVVVLFGAFIAACSPAASVAPSPTATPVATPTAAPTVAPTPAPTPSPSTATASASAAPDPSIGLKISAPYTLAELDPTLEATFRTQFAQGAGAFGSLIGLGGRTINKDGAPAGFVFVIGFPTGMLTATAYQAMITGMEPGMGVSFTTEEISGVDVSIGESAAANVAAFKDGDNVVLTISPTAAELPTLAKALIDANK